MRSISQSKFSSFARLNLHFSTKQFFYFAALAVYIWQQLLTRVSSVGLQNIVNTLYPLIFIFSISMLFFMEIVSIGWTIQDNFF